MNIGAVILAAGQSRRMGGTDKLFLPLGGRPVLGWSLEAFRAVPEVAVRVVVAGPHNRAQVRALLTPEEILVEGGARRQDSVRAGVEALPEGIDAVLIHDGARPRVTPELIRRAIEAVQAHGAAVPGIPVADTIKEVGSDGRVVATPDRSRLRAIQTPQAFRLDLLRAAYDRVDWTRTYTDEGALLEAAGTPVYVFEGDPRNRKLTRPEDLPFLEALSSDRAPAEVRVGYGYDVHRVAEGRRLVLGGVEIPWEGRGLAGHSDADVLLHALMDALLGAAGMGDIGRHFPPSDPAYRGADSRRLLERVVAWLREAGWQVVHVDLTLIAQAPRIAPYADEMRARIARTLGIDPGRVNLKATTPEGLGALGRGEGMAAHAVALIRRG